MVAKLIAVVLPLGLDTFGVALALGAMGLPRRRRLRLSILFTGFEAGMPLLGVLLGAPLGHAIGNAADDIAGALLAALGLWMLAGAQRDDEDTRLLSLAQGGLLASMLLGASISLDELAIGFSAGLLRVPLVLIVVAIAVQAFLVTQIGLRLGSRAGENTPEVTEKLAGAALLVLGIVLLIESLTR